MNTKAASASLVANLLPEYVAYHERHIAAHIIASALDLGYTVGVFDGEEFPVKRSTDAGVIAAAMASTDADNLVIRHATDGKLVGRVVLIWGNGRDLISDYVDNDGIERVLRAAESYADRIL